MFLKGAEPATALSACLIVFLHISNTNSMGSECVCHETARISLLSD